MIHSFSIIIPVLNKENEIIRTLESIEASIAYFYEHYDSAHPVEAEVLIVNEGSSDRTLERVTEFSQNKPYYKIINHFKSLGIGPARNTGAKISKGDILFFPDGDDLIFKEHIYLCFKLLNHHPATATEPSFTLNTERGSLTLELPRSPVGIVRTGIYMKDPLHPHWKAAIENTITLNLCVRRDCHEFMEGFPEAPVYKQIGCEDISYDLWIDQFFKVCRVGLETVEYIRYPGNNFDRQLKKFQTPPGQYQDDTPPAERELHGVRMKLEQDKLGYLLDKFRRSDKSSEFFSILNWQKLAIGALSQNQFSEAIALFERGISLEPEALETCKDPLAVAYNNQGSAYRKQGSLSQATTAFKKALALNPNLIKSDLARIYFNLGTALKEQKEFNQALLCLQKSLELEPNAPEAIAELNRVKYQTHILAKGYQFSQLYLSSHSSVWKQHLNRLIKITGLNVLEVNSGEGESTCWLIDNILTDDSARMTCINTFEAEAAHPVMFAGGTLKVLDNLFKLNTTKTGHLEKINIIAGKPQDKLRLLPSSAFHLVYVGGPKPASDILESALLIWGLVKVGGMLIFDHYGFSFDPGVNEDSPSVAINAFRRIFNKKIKIIHEGYQILLEKIAE
jgi:glycosyltransferase involved in cell wall biosynthesis/Tfp pilus assembly protein PilF